MNDEQIIQNGGGEIEIEQYANQNGADLTKEDTNYPKMKPKQKINSITIVNIGKIFSRDQRKRENKLPHETTWIDVITPIEIVYKNVSFPELPVWFRQGNREWNAKYVIEVEYYTE